MKFGCLTLSIILVLSLFALAGCTKSTIDSPDGPTVVIPSTPVKPNADNDKDGEPDTPYINEDGEEDILPDNTPSTPNTDGEQYFVPDSPKDYEGYSIDFIQNSMAGMSYKDIIALWGEGDMHQESSNQGITAYFIDGLDIVIHYNLDTNEVLNITGIEQ